MYEYVNHTLSRTKKVMLYFLKIFEGRKQTNGAGGGGGEQFAAVVIYGW